MTRSARAAASKYAQIAPERPGRRTTVHRLTQPTSAKTTRMLASVMTSDAPCDRPEPFLCPQPNVRNIWILPALDAARDERRVAASAPAGAHQAHALRSHEPVATRPAFSQPPPSAVKITVRSAPSGATVHANGALIGETEKTNLASGGITSGEYLLRVRALKLAYEGR